MNENTNMSLKDIFDKMTLKGKIICVGVVVIIIGVVVINREEDAKRSRQLQWIQQQQAMHPQYGVGNYYNPTPYGGGSYNSMGNNNDFLSQLEQDTKRLHEENERESARIKNQLNAAIRGADRMQYRAKMGQIYDAFGGNMSPLERELKIDQSMRNYDLMNGY